MFALFEKFCNGVIEILGDEVLRNINTVWGPVLGHFKFKKKNVPPIAASMFAAFEKFCNGVIEIFGDEVFGIIYTVEPRLTATSLIRPPRYYGHFFWSRQNGHTFSYNKTPLMRPPR